jgi:hypothetical protein
MWNLCGKQRALRGKSNRPKTAEKPLDDIRLIFLGMSTMFFVCLIWFKLFVDM